MKYRLFINEVISQAYSNTIFFIVNEKNESLILGNGAYVYDLETVIVRAKNLTDFVPDNYVKTMMKSHIQESNGAEYTAVVLLEFSELSELHKLKETHPELFL